MSDPTKPRTGLFSRFPARPRTGDRTSLFGGGKSSTPSRKDEMTEDSLRDIRAALTGQPASSPLEEELVGVTSRGMSQTRSKELVMNDRQMDRMSEALKTRARLHALERVQAARNGAVLDDEADLPRLHKAQKITFEGRTVRVHLGSRGTEGKNFVAIPELTQSSDSAVKTGRGVHVLDVGLAEEGKQNVALSPETYVQGARGLRLELAFSDQQENLRDKGQERS